MQTTDHTQIRDPVAHLDYLLFVLKDIPEASTKIKGPTF